MILDWINALGGWFWISVGLLLLSAEALGAAGFLLGAALSGLVVGIVVLLFPKLHWHLQFMLFGANTLILSVVYWKYFRRFNEQTDRPLLNNRAAQMIGRRFNLSEAVSNGFGRVQVGDTLWKVTCDQDLEAGTTVEVTGVDGTTLVIRAVDPDGSAAS